MQARARVQSPASTSQHDIERARIVPPSAEGLKQKEPGESLYVDVGILGHGSRTGHVLFTKRAGSIAGAYSFTLVFVLTGILALLSPPSLFFVMRPIARIVRD